LVCEKTPHKSKIQIHPNVLNVFIHPNKNAPSNPTQPTRMSKRSCPMPKVVSSECFDVVVHPLYKHSKASIPACLEIKANITSQTKDDPTTLIVLADVSGSMLEGAKMRNMRRAIERLGELAERFASFHSDFILIEFNDAPKMTHVAPKMPSTAELHVICEKLSPKGGTNIGAALDMALALALGKKAVHIALFTDGQDGAALSTRLSNPDDSHIHTLRTLPMLWLHCVGICTDFDSQLLDLLSRTARRSTFQSVKDENISALMGTLWGLMIEAVDLNCSASMEADGVALLKKQEVVLRVCDPPMPTRILVHAVPAGTKTITATLSVGEETKTVTFAFDPDAPEAEVDEVCASETIIDLQSAAFGSVAKALSALDFTKAADANAKAVTAIETLFDFETVPESVKQTLETTLKELQDQAHAIAKSQDDHDMARELELRALSRSSTTRNSGASLDPTNGRSLSELQTQLISP